ncbi:MAG TPA: hypothetical protein ACFYD0_09310 [Candidatus Wunengus sp. YC65]|uniref:hypothetical protein n=1 Tax=Candidatus Wunengus sp. YC65 TaxID=3367701 RepID=UPI004027D87C
MSFSIKKNYSLPKLELGTVKQAILRIAKEYNFELSNLEISADYKIGNIGAENKNITIEDLSKIVSFNGNPGLTRFVFNRKERFDYVFSISIYQYGDTFNVSYHFLDKLDEKIIKIIEEEFLLKPPPLKEEVPQKKVSDEDIKDKSITPTRPLKCFISYRFDDISEKYVLELNKFLSLIGILATTGKPYQPRSINEKVENKLRADIDFFIYLITRSGESTWIRDEAIYSKASGAYVFPLVEEGANIEQGLLGSTEYINFRSGCICDTFIPLLEGINYIKKCQHNK